MVKGDEKLLFLSDIYGETDKHIKRLVESARPVLDTIFKHVEDSPVTPVAAMKGNQSALTCPEGGSYYLCGNTWFSPSYGANGIIYRVAPTP